LGKKGALRAPFFLKSRIPQSGRGIAIIFDKSQGEENKKALLRLGVQHLKPAIVTSLPHSRFRIS
jgi:hypothetical protein